MGRGFNQARNRHCRVQVTPPFGFSLRGMEPHVAFWKKNVNVVCGRHAIFEPDTREEQRAPFSERLDRLPSITKVHSVSVQLVHGELKKPSRGLWC